MLRAEVEDRAGAARERENEEKERRRQVAAQKDYLREVMESRRKTLMMKVDESVTSLSNVG